MPSAPDLQSSNPPITVIIDSIEIIQAQQSPAATVAAQAAPSTPAEVPAASGINAIGPFGWIGIAFLCCIVFAGATNIYLKSQKKKFETPATPEELKELAGAFAKQ